MLFSIFIVTACTSQETEVKPISEEAPSNKPKAEVPSKDDTKGVASNLSIKEGTIDIRLPSPKVEAGVEKYCYFQEMPTLDVGMTSLQFNASDDVRFIRMQGVQSDTVNVAPNQWMNCAELGDGVSTVPIYEVVGVDLSQSAGTLFKGFNWFELPENTAFAFPGAELWMFEVQLQEGSAQDIKITTTVSTTPRSSVKDWAGVFEITMETPTEGVYQSDCTLPQNLNVLSAFGHSEPMQGTWTVSCADEEIFTVDSKNFALDVPPLKSFDTPKEVLAGSTCTLKCDWDGDQGEICVASLVATSLEGPMICGDGVINR